MKKLSQLAILLFIMGLAACGGAAESVETPVETEPVVEPENSEEAPVEETADLTGMKSAVVANYADMVYAGYDDSLATALTLQEALQAFVADPGELTQQAAKDAWLAAREPYGQTEVYRFYGGPIDDEDGPEGSLNAWPLDESYVDYVEGALEAGIINDTANYPEINADMLASLNEVGAEENISTGYHAIEFLLWGQDSRADGSGERSFTDYTTADNADRRGQYLLAAAELLVSDLTGLVDEWSPDDSDNYRASFLAKDPNAAVTQMLTGMGVLSKSELSGERMFVAYDNQDQEDEHSCFSDNTHRDIITNAQGIYNVYQGSYQRVDGSEVSGASLAELLAVTDADLAAEMDTLAEAALAATQDIHAPFDQAIVLAEYRPGVLDAVNVLQDQGDKLAEVASAMGISINTGLPE